MPPERETIVVIIEAPTALLRATFGKFIKSLGRRHGCRVTTYFPLASPPPTWPEFRNRTEAAK